VVVKPQHETAFPAQAGINASAFRALDVWALACAGDAIKETRA